MAGMRCIPGSMILKPPLRPPPKGGQTWALHILRAIIPPHSQLTPSSSHTPKPLPFIHPDSQIPVSNSIPQTKSPRPI
ncbi:hypothetical protein ACFX1R_035168 [Malus domestica]